MLKSDFPSRSQQLRSWAYHVGILVFLLVSFLLPPAFHTLGTVFTLIGIVGITLTFSKKTPTMSINQVSVYALVGVLASGFLCVAFWNSPAVILAVPAFLFLLLVTILILRVRFRGQNLQTH